MGRFPRLLVVVALAWLGMDPLSGTASAEPLPEMLARVAKSVVQVRVGQTWGSGCLYPSPHHVATSYSLINQLGALEVLLPGGRVARGRVVAWSELDDLAIVELALPAQGPALVPATASPHAGMDVVVLGYPKRSDPEEQAQLVPRSAPTPRFAKVSLAGVRVVALDLRSTSAGDLGAPIVNDSGQLVAVLSDARGRQRGVFEAASVRVLAGLLARMGEQGAFEPSPEAWTGQFWGMFATPMRTDHMYGVGLTVGYRYEWLTGTLADSFLWSGFEPTSDNTFVSKREFAFELYASADLDLYDHLRLSLGPGVGLALATEQTQRVLAAGVEKEEDSRWRVRPLLLGQLIAGHLFLSNAVSLVDPSFRLDFGFAFGR